MKTFWTETAAWHDRQAQFCRDMAAWYTEQIRQKRRENEQTAKWVWDRGVLTEHDMRLWGDRKRYRDIGTWDLQKQRRGWYRETAAEKRAAEECRRRAENA